MVNRLIKTEEDYEKALDRIEQLMDAKSGTDEMDELELLTTLVEMYEEKHYSINLPTPVEAIKFRMEQLRLTQKDMIPYIGSKSKVSEILNGKRMLTLAMMRSLNKNLNISAEVLLQEPGADFPDELNGFDWKRFPVAEMAKRCWLPKKKNVKEYAEELMRGFFGKADGLKPVSDALFRQTKGSRYNSKMDPYALMAWCARVLSIARSMPLEAKYAKKSINFKVMQEIARLSYFEDGPLLAKEYLNKQGIHLIVVPHLPKTYLDGAAMLLPDGTPVIGITIRHDRIDNFWFCLLHEIAHVVKHLKKPDQMIFDDLDMRGHDPTNDDDIEKEADEMARNALIPTKVWEKKSTDGQMKSADVLALAEQLKIHPVIIAGRIRFEKNNYKILSRYVGNKQIRKHFIESCSALK